MKGECSATTWDSWVAFLFGETRGREGLMRKTLHLPHEGECSATTWDSWVAFLCGASHSYWIDQKGGVTEYC